MRKIVNFVILIFTAMILSPPCFAANEIAFTTKKFGLAMLGVILSAILIFAMLSVYNKLFHNTRANDKSTYDDKNLSKPPTLDAAISNFLNKTKL